MSSLSLVPLLFHPETQDSTQVYAILAGKNADSTSTGIEANDAYLESI